MYTIRTIHPGEDSLCSNQDQEITMRSEKERIDFVIEIYHSSISPANLRTREIRSVWCLFFQFNKLTETQSRPLSQVWSKEIERFLNRNLSTEVFFNFFIATVCRQGKRHSKTVNSQDNITVDTALYVVQTDDWWLIHQYFLARLESVTWVFQDPRSHHARCSWHRFV